MLLFVAPLIVGRGAPDLFAAPAVGAVADAWRLHDVEWRPVCDDLLHQRPPGQGRRLMFTGIVEEVGVLRSLRVGEKGAVLDVAASTVTADARVGDSILTDGCCLTVTSVDDHGFTADVQPETVRRTTFAQRRAGDRLNLERALTLQLATRRSPGELATSTASVSCRASGARTTPWSSTSRSRRPWRRLSAAQGRITIDGVSLTDRRRGRRRRARVADSSHGLRDHAGFHRRRPPGQPGGRPDRRYVHAFVAGHKPAAGLTWEKLAEAGF